jgi:transposase-like protein
MHSKTATRRRHDDELKSRVLAECDEAGASAAGVAR